MKNLRQNAESGQAIILVALMIVGLLGMSGLALDGGGMYFLQRDAQNAADAAAFSGAYALCTEGDVEHAALESAANNGFPQTGPGRELDTVTVTSPIIREGVDAPESYVEVVIVAQKPSYFIQIVYQEPLTVTVKAVGHCDQGRIATELATVVGLSTTCQNAINIPGGNVDVEGSVVSNSDLKVSSSDATITGEGYYVGDLESSPGVYWGVSPARLEREVADPQPYRLEDYSPTGYIGASAQFAGQYYYVPGDMHINTNQRYWVLEGLMYVEGNFQMQGTNYEIGPEGFTLVATGSISFSASYIDLYPWFGAEDLLLMSGQTTNCGNNAITLTSDNTYWEGMIYAPSGGIGFHSNDNSTADGGMIGQTVTLSGSDIYLSRNPGVTLLLPPSMSLAE